MSPTVFFPQNTPFTIDISRLELGSFWCDPGSDTDKVSHKAGNIALDHNIIANNDWVLWHGDTVWLLGDYKRDKFLKNRCGKEYFKSSLDIIWPLLYTLSRRKQKQIINLLVLSCQCLLLLLSLYPNACLWRNCVPRSQSKHWRRQSQLQSWECRI